MLMKKGKIIKIISNLYTVKLEDKQIECHARGKFRNEKITPLVGDLCEVDEESKIIMNILPRENYLLRPSIANIDVALIVTSMKKPDFSPYLLDKLITLIYLNQITPMICFTKIDLLSKEELSEFKILKKYYDSIGIKTFANEELAKLKTTLKGKTLVVTGQTGAGKSSLLNRLDKSLDLKTSPISEALNRGVHTTRHTEIYPIDSFYIADTPGFSALDLSGYQKEEIATSFKEFLKYPCQFQDCIHRNEPGCGVKEAVQRKDILKTRYDSYLSLIDEVKVENKNIN